MSIWKVILSVKYVYKFSLLYSSETFINLRRNRGNIFTNIDSSKQIFQLQLNSIMEMKFVKDFWKIF